jgi:hypothetical protein
MEAQDKDSEKEEDNCINPNEAPIGSYASSHTIPAIFQRLVSRSGLGIDLTLPTSAHARAASNIDWLFGLGDRSG